MNNEKNMAQNHKKAAQNQTSNVSTFRVFDTDLNNQKVVRFALLKVFGFGLYRTTKICKILGISDSVRVKDLTEDDVLKIQNTAKAQGYLVTNDLRQELITARSKLNSIKCNRANRFRKGLPCRGQRTHSNGSTASRLRGKI